jgi:uncharacterized membrane protein
MSKPELHPYQSPEQVSRVIDALRREATPLVHPQHIIAGKRAQLSSIGKFNGWLADHIVGLAGTMVFFYLLCVVMAAWALWQGWVGHNTGFDPFPFAFLFFILGGIMQSLFVPTMLTASNRSAERDRIKDEADHRAWSHLYDVNDEQLRILRALAAKVLADTPPA